MHSRSIPNGSTVHPNIPFQCGNRASGRYCHRSRLFPSLGTRASRPRRCTCWPARLGKSTTVDWQVYRAELGSLPRQTDESTALDFIIYRARLPSLPRLTSQSTVADFPKPLSPGLTTPRRLHSLRTAQRIPAAHLTRRLVRHSEKRVGRSLGEGGSSRLTTQRVGSLNATSHYREPVTICDQFKHKV